ncbi:MAG: hypothetical protein HY332_00670 [Chloroflexi bacterium]|nr:hypothetical protein [Chloroflexota bacterium]
MSAAIAPKAAQSTGSERWTGRARLWAALRGTPADRIAWSPLLGGYWASGLSPEEGSLPMPDLARAIGSDLFLRMGGGRVPPGLRTRHREVKVRQEKNAGPAGQTLTVFETPRGQLRGTAVPDEHGTSWRQEFVVKSLADYDALSAVWEDLVYEPNHDALSAYIDSLGEEGLCVVNGPDAPLVTLFRNREQQELLYDLADEPEQMTQVLDRIHAKAMEGWRILADGPGEVFIQGCSYLGTQLISPAMYRRHVMPYLTEYATLLHRRGKKILAHMCGHIWDLLDLAQDTGLDGIESFAPPPVGNTPVGAALERVRRDFCLIGGIDPVVLKMESPAGVRAHTRGILEDAAGHPNFILGSGDAVAAGTPMANLRAVTQAVRDVYGSAA